MRVLRSFFLSLVILLVLGGLALVSTREILLTLAVSNLRDSISVLRQIGAQTGPYILECQRKGLSDEEEFDTIVSAVQLRFTSPTSYVIEVVCTQFPSEPIVVAEKKLPWPAEKVMGSSGIVWGGVRSGVTLDVWGRQRSIVSEDLQVTFSSQSDIDLGVGPVTSCAGYGYTCCNPEITEGVGSLVNGVTDCPKTCYLSCTNRPVVLSFTSQPFFDPELRTVTVGSGETVDFNYVIDPRGTGALNVTLDFGDGEVQELTTDAGAAQHVYRCVNRSPQTGDCRFTAMLQSKTSGGVTSAVTPVSQLTVVVK